MIKRTIADVSAHITRQQYKDATIDPNGDMRDGDLLYHVAIIDDRFNFVVHNDHTGHVWILGVGESAGIDTTVSDIDKLVHHLEIMKSVMLGNTKLKVKQ